MPEPIRAVSVRRLNLPDEDAPRPKKVKPTTTKGSQSAADNDGQSADTPKEN